MLFETEQKIFIRHLFRIHIQVSNMFARIWIILIRISNTAFSIVNSFHFFRSSTNWSRWPNPTLMTNFVISVHEKIMITILNGSNTMWCRIRMQKNKVKNPAEWSGSSNTHSYLACLSSSNTLLPGLSLLPGCCLFLLLHRLRQVVPVELNPRPPHLHTTTGTTSVQCCGAGTFWPEKVWRSGSGSSLNEKKITTLIKGKLKNK